MVTAFAFAGTLNFNPLTDSLKTPDGKSFKLTAPKGLELPPKGFDPGEDTYQAPPETRSNITIKVDPKR